MQTAVLVTGRFSGMHTGHAKLITQAYNKYVATNKVDLLVIGIIVGDKAQLIYNTYHEIKNELEVLKDITDKKDPLLKRKKELLKQLEVLQKNPFEFDIRKEVIQKFINKASFINKDKVLFMSFPNAHTKTIKEKLEIEQDISVQVVFCGEDRKEEYDQMLNRLENKEELGYVVDYIERDLEDKKSGSGTQIRKALIEDNYEEFTSLMPEEFDEELIKEVYDIYRSSLKEKGLISSSNSSLAGITHIEDLDIDDFLFWLENLYNDNIELIQKLDGTFNMSIVRTNEGIHFARLAKKQENSFTSSSLPKNPLYNALRGACKALEDNRIQQVFIEELLPNEALDIEVLYGIQPNTIKYNLDANYLAVLRFIRTNKDRIEQNEAIQTIINKLKTIIVKINNTVYYYDWDKESLSSNLEEESWKFTTPQVYNKEKLKTKISFEDDIKNILNWAHSASSIPSIKNKDILDIKLIGMKKDIKEQYKEAREKAIHEFKELKLNVKTKIAENILKDLEFDLGGTIQEGLVVKDINDPTKLTKFVDRQGFTKENRRNWHYMELIGDGLKIGDEFKPGVAKMFFSSVGELFNVNSFNAYKPFLKKMVPEDLADNILNAFDENVIEQKITLTKSLVNESLEKIKGLKKQVDNDNNITETFRKRTLDSLGVEKIKYENVKKFIDKNDSLEPKDQLIALFYALKHQFSRED